MSQKKFLIIGAHPDDPDLMFGGSAIQAIKNGHKVKFISTTDGRSGHQSIPPEELVLRRRKEADNVAGLLNLSGYEIMDNPDGELMLSLDNRKNIIKAIREFSPDVVISHRSYDYHADHRTTALLVQDAAFLVMVPSLYPQYKIPKKNPIFMFSYDTFKRPSPFKPNIVVSIDDVLEAKIELLSQHESQFFEWLPWCMGFKKNKKILSKEGRVAWLKEHWISKNRKQALEYKQIIADLYSDNSQIKHIESFELSEYGHQPNAKELSTLFNINCT